MHHRVLSVAGAILAVAQLAASLAAELTFPFEDKQLTPKRISTAFWPVKFGNSSSAQPLSGAAECRAFPGDKGLAKRRGMGPLEHHSWRCSAQTGPGGVGLLQGTRLR